MLAKKFIHMSRTNFLANRVCVCVCVCVYTLYSILVYIYWCFPGGTSDKEPDCQCRRCRSRGFIPWVKKIPGEGNGYPLQYSCENSWRIPWTCKRSLVDYIWNKKVPGTIPSTMHILFHLVLTTTYEVGTIIIYYYSSFRDEEPGPE